MAPKEIRQATKQQFEDYIRAIKSLFQKSKTGEILPGKLREDTIMEPWLLLVQEQGYNRSSFLGFSYEKKINPRDLLNYGIRTKYRKYTLAELRKVSTQFRYFWGITRIQIQLIKFFDSKSDSSSSFETLREMLEEESEIPSLFDCLIEQIKSLSEDDSKFVLDNVVFWYRQSLRLLSGLWSNDTERNKIYKIFWAIKRLLETKQQVGFAEDIKIKKDYFLEICNQQ